MRKSFANQTVFAVFFFVLGMASFWGGQKILGRWFPSLSAQQEPTRNVRHQMNFEDPFGDDQEMDPFVQMQRMQQQMMSGMMAHPGFTGNNAGKVEQREDDKFVYLDIFVKGVDQNKLKVNIENGQITISGEVEQKPEDSEDGAAMVSTFHRSFPAPAGTDAEKVQVESTKDKITLKFPKVS